MILKNFGRNLVSKLIFKYFFCHFEFDILLLYIYIYIYIYYETKEKYNSACILYKESKKYFKANKLIYILHIYSK